MLHHAGAGGMRSARGQVDGLGEADADACGAASVPVLSALAFELAPATRRATQRAPGAVAAQLDGLDSDENEIDDDDENDGGGDGGAGGGDDVADDAGGSAAAAVAEEDELGSDLDDDDQGDEETANMVLCQFEKVVRSRNKWKLNLQNGIANINGEDYVFHKAAGDFTW